MLEDALPLSPVDTTTPVPTQRNPGLAFPVAKGATRGDLLAALGFLDALPTSVGTLTAWFDNHLVADGRMSRPAEVLEVLHTPIRLDAPGPADDLTDRAVQDLVLAARERVIRNLMGLMVLPRHDAFVTSAVAEDRVRRDPDDGWWRAHPREGDYLSDIVLNLFAADFLNDPPYYEVQLCICKTCNHVSFDPVHTGRTGCVAHRPTGPIRRHGRQTT